MRAPGHQYTSKELAAVMRGVELFRAVEAGNPAAVRALLAQDAALNISIGSGGDTALLRALKNKNPEIVKMLLDKGADVNARDNEDTPLLIWAMLCAQNNVQIVELFLSRGADINAKDRNGATPLMFAVNWGYTEVVRLLVERGADLSLKNKAGETALSLAEETGPLQVIDGTEIAKILRATTQPREGIDFTANYWVASSWFNPVEKQINDLLATGDPLAGIVHAGNVEKARAFFNELFWADKNRKPQWEHLQLALLTENKPMLRLLITWGASCTAENMGELKQVTAEKYPHYAALLRSSGLRVAEAAAVNDASAPARPKVGDKMPDGTVYAGFSPDTQKPIYAAAEDASLTMTFNQAAEYAAKLEVHGHTDWRVPTREELNVLYQNKDKGFLKGTFSEVRGDCWYWSSTQDSEDSKHAYYQRFDYGQQGSFFKSNRFLIRCVRG
ncbi:MAG: ankyrin repeat domain-containing protein [Alphaproteobacteria bacterium]|nr:ankyrin repeat domain-containing protein [Alphaproteobacteria bacterium]